MPVFKLFIPNVITPSIKDNANDIFTIPFGDQKGTTPAYYRFKTALEILNRWGKSFNPKIINMTGMVMTLRPGYIIMRFRFTTMRLARVGLTW